MSCANHPDVAAIGVCRECGRPLCSLCVHFRDGQFVCAAHAEGPAAGNTPAAQASPAAAPSPGDGAAAGTPGPIVGTVVALPVPRVDARLEPLPLSMRPGWPDEPPVPRPSALAENLGLAGLICGVLALPFNICCGFGAIVGVPVALIGVGLSIVALVGAPRTRNPGQARWTGGLGAALNALSLGISICYVASFATLTTTLGTGLFATP